MRLIHNPTKPTSGSCSGTREERPLDNRVYIVSMIADCRKRILAAQKFKERQLIKQEFYKNKYK